MTFQVPMMLKLYTMGGGPQLMAVSDVSPVKLSNTAFGCRKWREPGGAKCDTVMT